MRVAFVRASLCALLAALNLASPGRAADPEPLIRLRFNDGESDETGIGKPPFTGMPGASMRFGLADLRDKKANRLLTYDPWGRTNNCVVRIDARREHDEARDYIFGHTAGFDGGTDCKWVETKSPLGKDARGRPREGCRSIWVHGASKVKVTQTVEVVFGDVSNALDTCLVVYEIENGDTAEHQVGLRFLLDTYIGQNDGVPFLIPGQANLCSTKQLFDKKVPDFIEAMERDSLKEPGTVARVQFNLGGRFEAPGRVFLGGWPDGLFNSYFGVKGALGQYTRWHVPEVEIKELERRLKDKGTETKPDSAVTMYWDVKPLKKGEKRTVAFTYGLGQSAAAKGDGRLALSIGGRLVRGDDFTVSALVGKPEKGEKLTLKLPDGLELVKDKAEQEVPPVEKDAARPISAVTWRVKASKEGEFELQVTSSSGVKETKKVKIAAKSVFD